jgi:gliding motility-associated lipoprotein GldH
MCKNNIFNFIGLLTFICLLLFACDRTRVYEQNVKIPGGTWNKENIIHFRVNISDTVSPHNVYINLRNDSKYAYCNIFLFVSTHAPNGITVRDTFEMTLADAKGKWLGKGIGNAFSNQVLYLKNVRFPYRGIYVFDIEQAMWNTSLAHMIDAGLRIEKVIK